MKKAFLFAFMALFLWGIHGPAGRYLATNGVSMFFVFASRLWLGTLVFFIFLLCKRQLQIDWLYRIKKVLVIAGIGVIANTIIFHKALDYLPGTFVMILENLSPVFVLSASLFFYGLKPKVSEIVALLMAFLGVFVIVMGKGEFPELADGYYIGIILGALTGVTFGAYIFFSADLMSEFKGNPINVIKFLFKIFLISAIVSTPFLFIYRDKSPTTTLQWLWLIEMGIMQSGFAYLLWNYALVYIKANTASILFILTILFTTINEVIFLNLKLNTYLVIGAILISFAGYWITVSLTKNAK